MPGLLRPRGPGGLEHHNGGLWRRTRIAIEPFLKRRAKQRGVDPATVKLAYGRAAEFQRRAVIHLHIVIRLDGYDPDHPDAILPPPRALDAVDLVDAVEHAARTTHFWTAPTRTSRAAGVSRWVSRPRRGSSPSPPTARSATPWSPATWPGTPPNPPRQVAEKQEAGGTAYPAKIDGGYVAADELGWPLHPERYSDEFGRLAAFAAVPKCSLHDCRHSVNSLLEKLGVPDSLRAAWIGHTVVINRGTYLHSRPEELAVISAALGEIFTAV